MTLLKTRMMQDLKLAGHALKTQKTYVECIGLFAQVWCRAPQRGRRCLRFAQRCHQIQLTGVPSCGSRCYGTSLPAPRILPPRARGCACRS
jgi:hypothetical protein